MKHALLFALFIWVNGSGVTVSVASSPGVTDTEIVLGQSAAFSGPSAGLGIELWTGAQLYFDEVNRQGGVGGRKIRVLRLDDQYNPEKTLPNTIDLIAKHKVFALFGFVGTPTLQKALPVLQKFQSEDIFLFSNFTGAQIQREAPYKDFVYNVRASYREETEALVEKLTSAGYKNIGLFIQDDAYGRSGATGTVDALKKRGLSVTVETNYTRGSTFETSMSEQVKILENKKTDAIISVGAYAACAALIRDARNHGFMGPIANVSFVGTVQMVDLLLSEEERTNKVLTQKLLNSQVVPFWEENYPVVQEYLLASKRQGELKKEFEGGSYTPKPYSFGGLEGYINAKAFVAVLKKIKGPITRKAFRQIADRTENLNLGLGEVGQFSKNNRQALHRVYFTTVTKKRINPVKSWDFLK